MAHDASIDDCVRRILKKHNNIRLAKIFGSMARRNFNRDSDLDVAIETEKAFEPHEKMQLIEALALSIGRPVDLIDLPTVRETLFGQIITSGRRIMGSNACYAKLLKNTFLTKLIYALSTQNTQ